LVKQVVGAVGGPGAQQGWRALVWWGRELTSSVSSANGTRQHCCLMASWAMSMAVVQSVWIGAGCRFQPTLARQPLLSTMRLPASAAEEIDMTACGPLSAISMTHV
jgi:hypothetical protein